MIKNITLINTLDIHDTNKIKINIYTLIKLIINILIKQTTKKKRFSMVIYPRKKGFNVYNKKIV